MAVPEIFDRHARRLRRGRTGGGGFFADAMADDLLDRLNSVTRAFHHALVVGHHPRLVAALVDKGVSVTIADPCPARAQPDWTIEEDAIVLEEPGFDLILASGTLDTVADLPGALLLLRRALFPDGLLLANFAGSPSLTTLRAVVADADAESGRAVARIHPQIDVRTAGDLLVRAGFSLCVADLETLDVAYSSLAGLVQDLRSAAATNVLASRHGVSRRWLATADRAFSALADESGRTHETLSYITCTGWAPGPDQPRPAPRGSGTSSLADVLGRRQPPDG